MTKTITAIVKGSRMNVSKSDQESLKEMLSPKVKLVCITHASNVTGVINDVKAVAKLAHENGALVLVDGAQSVSHMPINVEDLGCDFMASSGHKMLGPTGKGVLYGKREILEKLETLRGGGR